MWPPRDPFIPNFAFFSLELTARRLPAKFEVSSFNRSQDIRSPKIPKVGHATPHGPFWPDFADFGYFFPFYICLLFLTRIASSMTDIWLLTITTNITLHKCLLLFSKVLHYSFSFRFEVFANGPRLRQVRFGYFFASFAIAHVQKRPQLSFLHQRCTDLQVVLARFRT